MAKQIDKQVQADKLWAWFIRGAHNTPIADDVKPHAFELYMTNLEVILHRPEPEMRKDLAATCLCARRTGEYASAYAEVDDRTINIDDFDYAAQRVRDEYNQGLGGPLCS